MIQLTICLDDDFQPEKPKIRHWLKPNGWVALTAKEAGKAGAVGLEYTVKIGGG